MTLDEATAGDATATLAPEINPRRYYEAADPGRAAVATRPPVCLYLEVTNRCNLLCTTCPRTYVELEPPADLSWALFRSIVDQIPDLKRAVLHGVGEPMLVFGWNGEMQMRSAARGLRIEEVAVGCRNRVGGVSKVSGRLGPTLGASVVLVRTVLRLAIALRRVPA